MVKGGIVRCAGGLLFCCPCLIGGFFGIGQILVVVNQKPQALGNLFPLQNAAILTVLCTSGDFKIFAHVVKKAVPTITEDPCAAADAVFFFQPAGLIFFDRKYLCREILLNAKFAIFKPAAFAQCIGNVLLRNVLAGCVNDGLVQLFGFCRKVDIFCLLLMARQPCLFRIFGSKSKLLHLLRHGCSLDGNHQTPLLDKVSNLCGNSIPCQIDLRCFGKIVALPKFKVHIMPDKTNGMVIHEQICINLLVTVLAKGAALGKVGMLIEIFQNSRIVGTAGGFFRQQA